MVRRTVRLRLGYGWNPHRETICDHSRRWGLLLGTVSGLQWLLSGFLERKLLSLISAAVMAENKHQRLCAWAELPFVKDMDARMSKWQVTAAKREAAERRAVQALQSAWRRSAGQRRIEQQRRLFSNRRTPGALVAEDDYFAAACARAPV